MTTEGGFLGRGWAFPVAEGEGGDVAMAVAEEDIRQAVRLILETSPGERVMRPDFGSGLRDFVFAPITTGNLALIRRRVEQALVAWEPRIDVERVEVAQDDPTLGRLLIRIGYRVRATNTFYNLVYPFYLREAAAP
jgi:uncharacterized protein